MQLEQSNPSGRTRLPEEQRLEALSYIGQAAGLSDRQRIAVGLLLDSEGLTHRQWRTALVGACEINASGANRLLRDLRTTLDRKGIALATEVRSPRRVVYNFQNAASFATRAFDQGQTSLQSRSDPEVSAIVNAGKSTLVEPQESSPSTADGQTKSIAQTSEAKPVFDQIYEGAKDKILRYLLTRVGNAQIAEDLTGDVFLKAFEALPGFEDRGIPMEAWLFQIAHNRMVDEVRRNSKRPTVVLETVDNRLGHVEEDLIVDSIENDERRKQLRAAIPRLSPSQQTVLLMRLDQGLTYRQIAQATGKTEDNVKVIIYNAKLRLTRLLQNQDS